MKFLIIRLSSLGDVVISTSIVNCLISEFPDSDIYFLTKQAYSDILEGIIDDNKILLYPDDTVNEVRHFIKKLNTIGFDYIVDLHRNQRSFIISTFVKGKVLKSQKRNLSRRLLIRSKDKKYTDDTIIKDHHSALTIFGVSETYYPKIAISSKYKEFARKLDIGDKTVLLHPGAKWEMKKWGDQHFIELAELFKKENYEPVFISESSVSDFPYRSVSGLTLLELKGVLASTGLYIGNDSGPGHIAAALGTPTIAIFGPTHPALGFSPAGENCMVIQKEFRCSPCTLHGKGICMLNKTSSGECMRTLEADEVFEKAITFLEG